MPYLQSQSPNEQDYQLWTPRQISGAGFVIGIFGARQRRTLSICQSNATLPSQTGYARIGLPAARVRPFSQQLLDALLPAAFCASEGKRFVYDIQSLAMGLVEV